MSSRSAAIARAVTAIGGTAALMAGVTFAALQTNTVTLADNSISVTNDILRIYDGATFGTSSNGFSVNLTPGVESAKKPFYLKNLSPGQLSITAHVNPTPGPTFTAIGNAADVVVKIYDDSNNLLATTDLNALMSGQVALSSPQGDLQPNAEGNGGVPGTNGNYNITFQVSPLAFTNTGPASVSNIDFEFTGTAVPVVQ